MASFNIKKKIDPFKWQSCSPGDCYPRELIFLGEGSRTVLFLNKLL